MYKFKSFEIAREKLSLLGVGYYDPKRKIRLIFEKMKVLSFFIASFFSLCLYIVFEAKTLEEYVNTIFFLSIQLIGGLGVAHCIWNTDKMFGVTDDLYAIIDARISNIFSKTIYNATEKKLLYVNKLQNIKGITISIGFVILPISCVSMFKYYTTDLGKDAFDLPVHTWFPLDWRNPICYIGAIVAEYICGIIFIFAGVTLVGFGIGIYFWLFALTLDIKCDLDSIQRNSKTKQTRPKIVKQFCELVQFHVKVVQLSKDISALAEFIYMILFAWSLQSICSSMMILQMEIAQDDSDLFLTALLIMEICASFGLVLIACELGERASLAFSDIDYMVSQFDSYRFPFKVQRMMPIFVVMVQKPFRFSVFGSITCGRESFKNVINTGFSYFMVLRNADQI